MRSLRTRLVVLLLAAVLAVGFVAAGVAYRRVDREARKLMDDQLQQIATILDTRIDATPSTRRVRDEDIQVAIRGADGTLEYTSSPLLLPAPDAEAGFHDAQLGDESFRVYTLREAGRIIQVAQPIDVREDQAEVAAYGAFGPVIVLIPVLVAIIFLVVRAVLRPVRSIAASVSRRDVLSTEPLNVKGLPREIVPLVDEINRHLARQYEAMRRERNFISDAAHALRTPLAALQLQADVLDGSLDPAERAERLAALRSGIRRASRLSDQLVSLARIESLRQDRLEAVDLADVAKDVCEFYGAVADSSGVRISAKLASPLPINADRASVFLLLGNLVDNAVRYTSSPGTITLEAQARNGFASIRVMDEGPGLPEQELTRVFERFYRAPGDLNAGTGLGLSTVEGLVRQLNGKIILRNRSDRSGLIAEVTLPLAPGET